jgi:REP element-mobilizing transposase RayT
LQEAIMGNTFSSLYYHIIFGTKLRAPLLRHPFLERMHEYLGGTLRSLDALAIQVGGVEDHVHILARMKPTHVISDVLRGIKKASSDWAAERIRDFHWQDGYSAFSVGRGEVDRVEEYVRGQAEHHRRKTFAEEYRELLRANDIAFDERFLL